MKKQGNEAGQPAGSTVPVSRTESGFDQEYDGNKNNENSIHLLGCGKQSDMGEAIRRWESSRYIS